MSTTYFFLPIVKLNNLIAIGRYEVVRLLNNKNYNVMEQLTSIRRIICLCIIVLVSNCISAGVRANDKYTIAGTVVDKEKNPIIGASVVVEGTNNGTVTDLYGKFSLALQNPRNTIKVTFAGYKSAKFVVTGSETGTVFMADDMKNNKKFRSFWISNNSLERSFGAYGIGNDNVATKKSPSEIYAEAEEYYYGKNGKTVDYAKAFDLYKKAAELDYLDAQFTLGLMCAQGRGTSQNYSDAYRWYKKAAEQGHSAAQCNLGNLYFNGKGVSYGKPSIGSKGFIVLGVISIDNKVTLSTDGISAISDYIPASCYSEFWSIALDNYLDA